MNGEEILTIASKHLELISKPRNCPAIDRREANFPGRLTHSRGDNPDLVPSPTTAITRRTGNK